LVYRGTDGLVALLLRGDHMLNEIKAAKLPALQVPLQPATETDVRAVFEAGFGSLGPLSVKNPTRLTVIVDRSAATAHDFACGANVDGQHCCNVNWGRDLPEPALVADIRNVVAGDPSPDGNGALEICRGIEVGHIFQLRTKYSSVLKCNFLDETGRQQPMEMGCYGIGITRIVAAAIEQNHDERGIIWPQSIAPFTLAIVPIGIGKSAAVREAAEKLYGELSAAGIEVLLDDRDERPGVMFADMELSGIPHRVVIGDRSLKQGQIEYQGRRDKAAQSIALTDAIATLKSRVCAG
jgi:prolyl-tRNA synthetase